MSRNNSQPPARRDNRQNQQQQQMTDNEVITAQEKIRRVMVELEKWGPEIEQALPVDLPLKVFLSTINNALRTNPDLLTVEYDSLIQACVKAGYDGLRVDGREAAIVVSTEKGKRLARYMPMVFGLIKQILQCGAAKAVKAVIVYANEEAQGRFKMLEGTVQGIHHEPLLHGDKGPMIGAYALATIEAGIHKFEWMDKDAILDVRKESKFGGVWERWPTEMWKKTVIRRMRKSLAGTHVIIDMEAKDLFPQFDQRAHPQLAAPARPMRQISDQAQTESGVRMDFGNQPAREEEHVAGAGNKVEASKAEPEPSKASSKAGEPPLPVGDEEWNAWLVDFERKLVAAPDQAAVDKLVADNKACREAAAPKTREWVNGIITDRLAELASDAAADPAQGDGTNNDGPGASS